MSSSSVRGYGLGRGTTKGGGGSCPSVARGSSRGALRSGVRSTTIVLFSFAMPTCVIPFLVGTRPSCCLTQGPLIRRWRRCPITGSTAGVLVSLRGRIRGRLAPNGGQLISLGQSEIDCDGLFIGTAVTFLSRGHRKGRLSSVTLYRGLATLFGAWFSSPMPLVGVGSALSA